MEVEADRVREWRTTAGLMPNSVGKIADMSNAVEGAKDEILVRSRAPLRDFCWWNCRG